MPFKKRPIAKAKRENLWKEVAFLRKIIPNRVIFLKEDF
jgi:hypothetical protein